MRKRKSSEPCDDEDIIYSGDGRVRIRNDKSQVIRVIPISNISWLCLGLASGCILGSPWITVLKERLYGYRWSSFGRCILEIGDSGVDFCRTPVNCEICMDVDKIEEYHVSELTVDMFQEKYASSDRPVVIRNATLNWPAMEVLDYDWLKKAYLKDPETLKNEDKEECWYRNYEASELHLPSLRSVFTKSSRQLTSSLWYVGWMVCHPLVASLLQDLYQQPVFLHPDSSQSHRQWIFIGTPGPGAAFHIDDVEVTSWQAQLKGVKTWQIRPPPECWWSCGGGELSTVLYPGDIIVVNTNVWFHSTKIEGDAMSVVITKEFD